MSHGDKIKAAILAKGLELWRVDPRAVSARAVANALGMTHGNVRYHFGTSDGMLNAIAQEAVRIKDRVIVPMLITSKHPAVEDMPDAERKRYLSGL
jgi:AcrR family transcriptional regulator